MRANKLLSIVIPCHNEEEVLASTHQRLNQVLSQLVENNQCQDYEILYVNNGSTDQTQNVLKDIFDRDSHVRILALRKNFGFQGSITAGLFHAKGDMVVTIDADLQDPPEKIGEMIEFYQKDYDLVLGVRQNRSTDSWFKKISSENYYRFLKWMGVEVVHNHGDFRLMARSLVDEFNNLSERNRLIRVMILTLDNHFASVYYNRAPRRAGKTKFNLRALFSLCFDGIVSFSYMPLRLISIIGMATCAISVIGVIWVVYAKIVYDSVPGWASTVLPIFVFGGLQLLFLGIIGEYIGRLYAEVKLRPLFIVRKEYNHDLIPEGVVNRG